MARIRQEDIEAVKERTDIVALVGQYLTLKKSGHDSMSGSVPVPPGEDAVVQRGPRRRGSSTASGAARAATRSRSCASWSAQSTSRRSSGSPETPASRCGTRATRLPNAGPLSAASRCTARTRRPPSCTDRCSPTGARRPSARVPGGARGSTPEAIETSSIGYAPGYPDFLLRRLAGTRDLSPEIMLGGRRRRPRRRRTACATGSAAGSRSRSRTCRAATSGSARASCPAIATRRRAGEVPEHRRDADLPKHEVLYNMHRARPRRARKTARCSSSRATPT